jgi:hypothetical protein
MASALRTLWGFITALLGSNKRVRQLRRWCIAMNRGFQYPITLSNVAYDISGSVPRASRAVVGMVMRRALAYWSTIPAGDGGAAARILSKTLNIAEADLFCQGPELKDMPERVSHIVDRGALQQFYLMNTSRAELIRPHVRGSRATKVAIAASNIKSDARVRGERPYAWITPTATIEDIESNSLPDADKLANRVRDYLGLDHYTDHELFEMIYPPHALDIVRVAAPTFIEGACREVYRSKTAPDRWGRSVDIGSARFDDGAPEAVHQPIPFTDKFSLRYLGVVRAAEMSEHEKLHARLRPWQENDMRALESIVLDEP